MSFSRLSFSLEGEGGGGVRPFYTPFQVSQSNVGSVSIFPDNKNKQTNKKMGGKEQLELTHV